VTTRLDAQAGERMKTESLLCAIGAIQEIIIEWF